MTKAPVQIQRINNAEYSFKLSSAEGVRYVVRALTFDNPDPYAYSPHIEKFNRRALTFPVGMLRTLTESLAEAGVDYDLTDYQYEYPALEDIDGRMRGRYEYQARAVQAFYSKRWGIVVVPTRGGKTFIAAEIARIFLATDSGNLLFCVDNTTLFTQAVEDFQRFFEPYGGIEVGEIRAGYVDTSHRVTVAMVQTLHSALQGGRTAAARDRRKQVEKYLRELRFLAVDEVHENCSDSRLKLYKRCKRLEYQLCLSATPYRTGAFVQNLKLMAWSGDVIYEITEEELREAGVLSDYKVFVLLVDHNDIGYKGVDEYDYADCRRKLIFESRFRNEVLKRAVDMFVGLGLKTLVLFQSVEHGRAFAETMGGVPFLSGETKSREREHEKKRFLDGEGGLLLASNIFKKGVTLPAAEVLINADEGLEDANTIQRKGRVLGATETKKRSLVVDFFDLYDAYFSDHSEARLNTYVDAVGEDKVGIVDVSVDGWLELIKCWTVKWFQSSD
jgi:superfamily II DNA or RNA helicase